MELRSGHAFWPIKNGLMASYPSLQNAIDCEVAVIGAGVTGALTSHALVSEGVDTVLLDRRDVASGSTAASTALLQYAADTELVDLIPMIGEHQAVRSYRLGREAVAKLGKLARSLGEDCGFEQKKSLYLASARSHVAKLRKEYALRMKHGFEVEFLEEKRLQSLYPFQAPAALLTAGDAQVDPYRFTHLLIKRAVQKGLRVFDRSTVVQIKTHSRGVSLELENGSRIVARRVVFATGYESQRYLKHKVGELYSTFAVITEPLNPFPSWPDHCLVWETSRPYCYLRATPDNRILIGGKDTPFATVHRQSALVRKKTRQLEHRLLQLFPGIKPEIAYSWAGTFGTTKDGLAYIGKSGEWPQAYFALGYGGNGMTMGLIAAELIADHYLGRDNPDAKIFSFGR